MNRMKRRSALVYAPAALLLAALLLAVGCGGGAATGSTVPGDEEKATSLGVGQYIVVLKPGVSETAAAGLAAGLAQRPVHSYHTVFRGFAGPLTASEHARLSAHPDVRYIEPDGPVSIAAPKKPKPPKPDPHPDPEPPQTLPQGIDDTDAELNLGPDGDPETADGGAGVAVAVIDTGIDYTHPDLAGAVVGGINVLNIHKNYKDDNGHGTHVSGIIAARDNEIGYVGMAPSASLVAVKVLDRNGNGTYAGVTAGVDWVAGHRDSFSAPIKVANMSLTGSAYSQTLHDAIQDATELGITFVVAAGNYDSDARGYYPAGFDNVICVSAMDHYTLPDRQGDGYFASFSNWGPAVDFTADGVDVWSTWKGGGYKSIGGTSMACPHVAGAAALWLDNHLTDGLTEVLTALELNSWDAPVDGWIGDPDGIDEPLVYAKNL